MKTITIIIILITIICSSFALYIDDDIWNNSSNLNFNHGKYIKYKINKKEIK